MRVTPLRNCLAGKYYTEGVEDDYEGPPNRHLEPVDKNEKAKWAKAIERQAADRTKGKPGAAPAPAQAPAPAAAAVPEPKVEKVDLASMTKAEIVEHAAEVHGLELDHSATKDELIEAVQEAEKGK